MFERTKRTIFQALVGTGLSVAVATAQAGTIFTNPDLFNAGAAGLTLAWTEGFEGFPFGSVADPLGIAGDQAEMVDGGNASIQTLFLPGKAWVQARDTSANATIRGFEDTELGVNALSFNFGNQLEQTVAFLHSSGTDTSGPFAPDPFSTSHFVGWIGDANEELSLARFVQAQGVSVDNVRGYVANNAVPEPTTIMLLCLGLAGLGFSRRRLH